MPQVSFAGPRGDEESGLAAEKGGGEEGEEEGVRSKTPIKFGWIQGVYMRCLLNIWGVMLFLRLTWVIGQAGTQNLQRLVGHPSFFLLRSFSCSPGLLEGLLLITLSNVVTVITSISMSAVSTNGQIAAGGIYYMISRSLGPEFGGAIGLMFTLANSIAVAMYTIGFCESLVDMLDQYISEFTGIVDASNRTNDIRLIGTITLILVLALAIVGMDWVTRVQMGLLVLLIISQIDFIVGSFIPPSASEISRGFVGYNYDSLTTNFWSNYTTDVYGKSESFFSVFAVFFPAVTGIVAGANLSGDLKDPGVAIPKGTLLAIATTYVTYFIYGVMVSGCTVRQASGIEGEAHFGTDRFNFTAYPDVNQKFDSCVGRESFLHPDINNTCDYGILVNQQMMEVISAWGPLIYAGCFAATLSSAIASLVGAPRVFQAVAKDKLFPGIDSFAEGYGSNNDPIKGYILVFIISLVCILIGDLNIVSSLLSNFFVAAYALINFSVFHSSITNSPGWRPSFKYYNKWVSLLGTVLCVAVMFLMDYITALITFIIIICLYMYVSIASPDVNWGSSTQSQSFMVALNAVQSLSKVEDHIKNYRPKVLCLCGNPGDRPTLIDFGSLLTKKISFFQCLRFIEGDLPNSRVSLALDLGQKWMKSNHVKAFFHVSRIDGLDRGLRTGLELCGLGKMGPNVVLVGFKTKWEADVEGTEDYVNTLTTVLESGYALMILRISGGMDASELYHNKDMFKALMQGKKETRDSGSESEGDDDDEENLAVEEKENDKPDQKNETNKDGGTVAMPLFPIGFFRTPMNTEHQKMVAKVQQFRGKSSREGTLDLYWLYDDGGLSLLLPHLLRSKPRFSHCNLRVFFITDEEDTERERKKMEEVIHKFRIETESVSVLEGVNDPPSMETEKAWQKQLQHATRKARKTDSLATLTEELAANKERTNFHLRLSELVKRKSKEAATMVIMTLPMPVKSGPSAVSPSLYMAWLDFVSRDIDSFLFVRGNQESVLTFYS